MLRCLGVQCLRVWCCPGSGFLERARHRYSGEHPPPIPGIRPIALPIRQEQKRPHWHQEPCVDRVDSFQSIGRFGFSRSCERLANRLGNRFAARSVSAGTSVRQQSALYLIGIFSAEKHSCLHRRAVNQRACPDSPKSGRQTRILPFSGIGLEIRGLAGAKAVSQGQHEE